LPGDGLIRVRVDISYDGREFSGWARQSDLRTVQGEMERALGHLVGSQALLTCAGRTDAGVHARGQVAHLDVTPEGWEALVDERRINRALPSDVRVTRVGLAPRGFHARFSALWRRYTYRVCDDARGPAPLDRFTVLPWTRTLDLEAMNAVASDLLGEHDFAAFCKQRPGSSTIRALQSMAWERDAFGYAVMSVRADAFCHSMVRALVGVQLPVGDGRRPMSWPSQVLRARVRDAGLTVMPPYPLVLEEVGYPIDAELLARQRVTRQVRTVAGP
jgi:tRNA pseudouridine38-40 synthase